MLGISHFIRRIWRHPSNRDGRWRALARGAWWQARSLVTRRPFDLALGGGMTLRCYPDSAIGRQAVLYGGRRDYHEMGLVAHLLRPGDRFLDVGANVGDYTILGASIVGAAGRVTAIEPGQPAAERLHENIELNRLANVKVLEVAVNASGGTTRFVRGRDTTNRIPTPADGDAPVDTVAAARLDDIVGDQDFAMGKMDIEGAELSALEGSGRMLAGANPPLWLLEMNRRHRDFGVSPEQLEAWLAARGYDLGLYDADSRTFSFRRAPWTERPNVVAVARSARARVTALVGT